MSIFLEYLKGRLLDIGLAASPNTSMMIYTLISTIDVEMNRVITVEEKLKELAPYIEKTDSKADDETLRERVEKLEDNIGLFSMKEANRLLMKFQGQIEKLEHIYHEKNFINYDHMLERIEKIENKSFDCRIPTHWKLTKRVDELERQVKRLEDWKDSYWKR